MKRTTTLTRGHFHTGVAPYPFGMPHACYSPPTPFCWLRRACGVSCAVPCCSALFRVISCCAVLFHAVPCYSMQGREPFGNTWGERSPSKWWCS
eukprot:gene24107-biopygen16394